MRVLWINPSFLDYRVPVYRRVNELLGGGLTVVFSKDRTPERVTRKIEVALGHNAIGLSGERRWEFGDQAGQWSNKRVRIPYQPRLLRTVMGIRADVVIGEGFFQWSPAGLIKSVWQKIPLIIAYERTRHTERACQRLRTAYRRMVLSRVDAMLTTGTECSEYVQSLGMPAHRISAGHMAADIDSIRERADSISPDDREQVRSDLGLHGLVFIVVGRLIELKGVRELLRAWAEFECRHENEASLLIVGDGPLRESLESLVSEQRLRNVRFTGAVEPEELPRYYAAADLLAMPSLEDNWALVVPEAMASGLPILCSIYNGGCRDQVVPGENGWHFDPLNNAATSQALEQCLAAREALGRMGQASLDLVQNHTPDRAAESILTGCKMALSNRTRSAAQYRSDVGTSNG